MGTQVEKKGTAQEKTQRKSTNEATQEGKPSTEPTVVGTGKGDRRFPKHPNDGQDTFYPHRA